MIDKTTELLINLFRMGELLEKEVIITNKYIKIGDFSYDHSCVRIDEAFLPAYGMAQAYYQKELYPWFHEKN